MRKGWEYQKLGEVLETTSGGTPSKSHKEYYVGGTIPWLRSGEVSKGDIYDAELYITEEGLKKSSAKLFPIDTVLIAMYGATVGQVGILKSTMCTNQAICGILPNKDFHPNFLKYVLLANKKNYLKQAIGGAQPNISQQVIKSTYIPIVKFSEQESVVSELDKINELIRLKKEQLKDFDNLAQSLFYEMFGDPVENEMGWEVKKLGEVCNITSSKRIFADEYTDKGIPFYRSKEVIERSKGLPISVELFISPERYSEIKEKFGIPNVGDILVTAVGTIGKIWSIDTDEKFYFKDGNLVWLKDIDSSLVNTIFFRRLLEYLIDEYKKINANGAAYSALTIAKLKLMQCPLPPLPLQHLFAQRIEQIEHQKAEVQKSITDLETLLASRMQYWFE